MSTVTVAGVDLARRLIWVMSGVIALLAFGLGLKECQLGPLMYEAADQAVQNRPGTEDWLKVHRRHATIKMNGRLFASSGSISPNSSSSTCYCLS